MVGYILKLAALIKKIFFDRIFYCCFILLDNWTSEKNIMLIFLL